MAYIGNSPGVASQRVVTNITATAGQTVFTPISGYTLGYVEVYQNGLLLVNGTEYTADDGQDITFSQGANLDDDIQIVAYQPRGLTDGYTKAEADARYEPIDSAYTKAEADARYEPIDSAYTKAESDSRYATSAQGSTADSAVQPGDLSTVATSGAYADLSGKPINVSSFTNDSGYATTSYVDTAESDAVATANAYTDTEISNLDALPSQSGNAGKYLTTDGTNASWGELDLTTFDAPVQLKNYTTAQRDSLTGVSTGDIIFNSTSGSLEFFDGANWVSTNLVPTLTNITGDITKATAGNLTLSGTNFGYPNDVVVTFTVSGTEYTATATPTDDSTVSVATPTNVYNSAVGTTVAIKLENLFGNSSGTINKTVLARPVTLSSITGDVTKATASNLTLSGSGFADTNLTVNFTVNAVDTDVVVTPSSDTSATVAVPAAVYNEGVGDTASIKVTNADASESGTLTKTIQGRAITLSSVSGNIYTGQSGTLTLSGSGFNITPVTVTFDGGNGTAMSVSSDTLGTVNIPSAIYNQSSGTVITIAITNNDGVTADNTVDKTISALPSGGSISSSGGYRYHTFTSSGTFTNTISSLSVQYVVAAGGGGGGSNIGGGGGAGGYRTNSADLSTGSYGVTVGGGGSGGTSGNAGSNGANSSFDGHTSIGGGAGSQLNNTGYNGGSGGGSGNNNTSRSSGTSGQGNGGGYNKGGGGGAASSGVDGIGSNGGNGGNGGSASTWLNGTAYSGGGGGAGYRNTGGTAGAGGGNGSTNAGEQVVPGDSASPNRAGGGGGGGINTAAGGNGGSGVVIIRYAV